MCKIIGSRTVTLSLSARVTITVDEAVSIDDIVSELSIIGNNDNIMTIDDAMFNDYDIVDSR